MNYRAEYHRKYYQKNKERRRQNTREWRLKNPDKVKEYSARYREKHKRYHQETRKKLKKEVFSYYGTVCQCCGEDTIEFLQIDHIDGNGRLHRKSVKSGTHFYYWLKKNNYPNGYQALCANCNIGKHLNKGICPHKEDR